jgi:hypothetical protein
VRPSESGTQSFCKTLALPCRPPALRLSLHLCLTACCPAQLAAVAVYAPADQPARADWFEGPYQDALGLPACPYLPACLLFTVGPAEHFALPPVGGRRK